MPIFRLDGDKLIIAQETNVELEQHLENWLENSPWAVIQDELVLWIDRQPSAQDEEGTIYPDLLGVDSEGNLVVVEFKRGKTPRSVVAQLLEYAAWANELPTEQIHEIANAYFEKRDEFKDKTFPEAFKEAFDIPETDELPPLKRKLRLFVVAEEIQPRVARVCRFLRMSYKMDVSCIAVSKFQTESGDEIINMETKVGNEDIAAPSERRHRDPQFSRWSGDKPGRQIVWEAVEELTNEHNTEFTVKDVRDSVMLKYPDFNPPAVSFNIRGDTVNQSTVNRIPVQERRYWQVAHGKYRLYDPEKDKIEDGGETD
jgi:hypothetical protein